MHFFELHRDLPREGPGDDASTERALKLLPDLPERPDILDVGCGPGAQTIVLARASGGTVTAVDRHQPYLDELMRRARAAGVAEAIHPLNASMDSMPLARSSFDVIWSEGAIYIMGFERGLRAWRPLLRAGGYVVVSELTWLTGDPPAPARTFWNHAYPAMRTTAENRATVERCGYEPLADFVLPKSAWTAGYYDPLRSRIAAWKERFAAVPDTLAWLHEQQREIDVFAEHGDSYGYVFYLMRRP